jgi:hypothetical protein
MPLSTVVGFQFFNQAFGFLLIFGQDYNSPNTRPPCRYGGLRMSEIDLGMPGDRFYGVTLSIFDMRLIDHD